MEVAAPGKINLVLRCGRPGPDGYHPLVTVFQAVGLREHIRAEAALPGQYTLTYTSGAQGLETDSTNLALRAAHALARHASGRGVPGVPGVHLTIAKEIPIAGGMAGGSADAAGTLAACNELWGLGYSRRQLTEVARTLGADVPFGLYGGIAAATGRGDTIEPLEVNGLYHWVLCTQNFGLSTPEVFRRFDRAYAAHCAPAPLTAKERADIQSGDPLRLAGVVTNDLEAPALDLRPELGDTLAALERAGALAAIVSGSGPTTAGLCLDAKHAESVARIVLEAQVCARAIVTSGPVPGAFAPGG